MARLIDDILAYGKIARPRCVPAQNNAQWEHHVQQAFDLLSTRPPVILCDNVSDYYYAASDQEVWSIEDDFPNIAPPYQMFWMEHRMPRVIHSKVYGDTHPGAVVPNGRQGALFIGARREDAVGVNIPDDAAWVLMADLFLDYLGDGKGVESGVGSWLYAIDAQGRAIGVPQLQGFHDPVFNDIVRTFAQFLHPSLLAISFLHCKNVRVVDNPVPPKLAKRYRERHGGQQPHAYKTLVIEPLKEILRTQGRAGEVGLAKAMHICRGHFADYTQGKGLFGKYHGKFWIPSTVRGTKRGAEAVPAPEVEVKL